MRRGRIVPFIVAFALVQTMATVAAPSASVASGSAPCRDPGGDPAVAQASGALDAPTARFTRIRDEDGLVTATTKRISLSVQLAPLAVTRRRTATTSCVRSPREVSTSGAAPTPPRSRSWTPRPSEARPVRARARRDVRRRHDGPGHASRPTPNDTVSVSLAFDDPTITHWGERLVTTPDEADLRPHRAHRRRLQRVRARAAGGRHARPQGRAGRDVRDAHDLGVRALLPVVRRLRAARRRHHAGPLRPRRHRPEPAELRVRARPAGPRRPLLRVRRATTTRSATRTRASTGRPRVPPPIVFLHWRGRDEAVVGPPVEVDGVPREPDGRRRPPALRGVRHPGRACTTSTARGRSGTEGYGDFQFDTNRFPDPTAMLRLMREQGWKSTVWISEWALDDRAAEARANGWLAPGSEREIDLTNRDAVRWLSDDLRRLPHPRPRREVDRRLLPRPHRGDRAERGRRRLRRRPQRPPAPQRLPGPHAAHRAPARPRRRARRHAAGSSPAPPTRGARSTR